MNFISKIWKNDSWDQWDRFVFELAKVFLWVVPFFVLIAIVQWPYRNLPFWNDSLGYMINNTSWMMENQSFFHPPAHDPGHHPMPFWGLHFAWMLFGTEPIVSHMYMWLNGVVFLIGMFHLGRFLGGDSVPFGILSVLLGLTYPYFFSAMYLLTPDLILIAMYCWMIYAFYADKRHLYILCFALLTWSKANSYFLIIIFAGVELFLLPVIQALWWMRDPVKLRKLLTWWIRWMNASFIGGIPILIWVTISRFVQGFWFVSPTFNSSFQYTFDFEVIYTKFTNGAISWTFWAGEGNRMIFSLTVLFIVLSAALILSSGKAGLMWNRINGFGKPLFHHILRPRYIIFISLAVQLIIQLFVFGLKDTVVHRYFMPTMLLLVILSMIACIWFVTGLHHFLEEKKYFGKAFLKPVTPIALVICMLFMTFNHMVRWDPDYTRFVPLPEKTANYLFENRNTEGYEWNLQFLSYLEVTTEAVQFLETLHHAAPNEPVYATYPFTAALAHLEGGMLQRGKPIESKNVILVDDLDSSDWEYFIHSTNAYGFWGDVNVDKIAQRPDVEIIGEFTDPDDEWPYRVVVFRNRK